MEYVSILTSSTEESGSDSDSTDWDIILDKKGFKYIVIDGV